MKENITITDDMLRVGVIASTHGIRGEVKVYPTTDDVKRFDYLKRVFLDYQYKGLKNNQKRECIELEVSGVKYFKQFVIVKFKGINDINDIEKYKGMDLYVSREDALPLEDNEYYISDLIGLDVINEEKEKIGTLKDVLQTGANDVYIIKGNEKVNNKEIMLPVIDECVLDVDLEKKFVEVHLLEGLLEL